MEVIFKKIINYFFLSSLVCLLFLFLSPTCTSSESYYADLNIIADTSGYVSINGVTNHPNLLVEDTEMYTSKKQSYWLLNITKNETFSDFIYEIILPEDSSINYIKSSGFISIEESLGRLVVKGFGQNTSLSIVVQYQIEKTTDEGSITQIGLPFLTVIISLSVAFVVVIYFVVSKQKEESSKINIPPEDEFKGLNERQKDIMKLLLEKMIPLTQVEIQKKLQLPKAAVSRNIRGLERKGLIEKERIGMSNLIRLKKP